MIVCTLIIVFYIDAAKIKNLLNKVNQQVQIVFTITIAIICCRFFIFICLYKYKITLINDFRRVNKNVVNP